MSDVPNFRDFDAELAEVQTDAPPVSFKLNNVVFRCIQPMPLGQILVLAKNSLDQTKSLETQAKQANLLWSFVEPEQHADLDEAIGKLQDPTLVTRIFEHLVVSSTGRPTQGP